jgi:hypothetical protein
MSRPSRGALLLVSLSRAESEEWSADEAFRQDSLRRFREMARERGRRFVEVRDSLGAELAVVSL